MALISRRAFVLGGGDLCAARCRGAARDRAGMHDGTGAPLRQHGAVASCERALGLREQFGPSPLRARCHLPLGHLYRQMGRHRLANDNLTVA